MTAERKAAGYDSCEVERRHEISNGGAGQWCRARLLRSLRQSAVPLGVCLFGDAASGVCCRCLWCGVCSGIRIEQRNGEGSRFSASLLSSLLCCAQQQQLAHLTATNR